MATNTNSQHYLSVAPRWALGKQVTQTHLNEHLADIIAKQGHQLFATTINEQVLLEKTREIKNAESNAVTLIGSSRSLGCNEKLSDDWLNITPHCFYRNLQTITGGIDVILAHAPDYVWGALNIQDGFFPDSKLVLFNHTFPENTNKSDKKNIREWAAQASVVISFDKETYDKYNVLYGSLAETGGSINHCLLEVADITMEILPVLSEKGKRIPPKGGTNEGNAAPKPPPLDKPRTASPKADVNKVNEKTSPVVIKTTPKVKSKTAERSAAVAVLGANFSDLNISSSTKIQTADWHERMLEALNKFHDNHAREPKKGIDKVRPFYEGTMKHIEGKLREKNLCVKFEYTGSAYEKVMIDVNDIEFDLMVIMSKENDLDAESFEDGTGGYFLLKPKEDNVKEYTKLIHSPEQQVVSPEKAVNMFFSALQKALNEIELTKKTKLRKHGPAVQMDVYSDVNKTQKVFSVDIVPAFQIKIPGEVQLFVAKPYRSVENMNLSWRRSFSVEEKKKFQDIDNQNGCRRKCVRILKAIKKSPQGVNRKQDSSFSHLTSFMIKNALFHENEDALINWDMNKLGLCIIGLIARLSGYLEKGYFPHFYLPGVNIIAGLDEGPRVNLANRLQRLISSEVEFLRVIGVE